MGTNLTNLINRHDFLGILAGGALGALVPRCHAEAAQAPTAETFTYKVVEGCEIKADVYGAEPGSKKPAMMRIHGGALMGGSRKPRGSPDHHKLLKLGFVIVSVDYRLAPETKVPGIIEDSLSARSCRSGRNAAHPGIQWRPPARHWPDRLCGASYLPFPDPSR